MDERSRLKHNAEQARYFDLRVDLFQQPIPESILDRTRSLVRAARLDRNAAVLDVGTGLGVLIPYILEQGVRAENIFGLRSKPLHAGGRQVAIPVGAFLAR